MISRPKPIIPWQGGKSRLAKDLLSRFPAHTCYVELFCGGAALFFLRDDPAKTEVINDLNGELVNLYRVVQNHLEEFVRQFKWCISSRQVFEWEKLKVPDTLTDIQRAARFLLSPATCFWWEGVRADIWLRHYRTTIKLTKDRRILKYSSFAFKWCLYRKPELGYLF